MVYLKAIEAHGFKSFAEKVNIKFDAGVTAVVGPNGSGKSNITDAIRWVLGEQSARSIRGVKMEDVIFNGTSDRKAMNYAYVRLVLDNQSGMLAVDESTVNITRKLYRNGDSEYYINEDRCRLKEINELFLDSGLGKNAYNIISQGEVDEVLKARPEHRRSMIEETAGVMKYKVRKNESEKRLEETRSNLSRVHDIISELDSRVGRLERESANAKEYLALKEEMAKSDIEVTLYDINELLTSLENEESGYRDVEAEVEAHNSNVENMNRRISDVSKRRDEYDQENQALNSRLVELSKKLESTNGRIELYKERKTNKGEFSKELEARLAEQSQRRDTTLEQINSVKKTIGELKGTAETLKGTLKDTEMQKEYLAGDKEGEIEKLKDSYYDKMVEKTTLENDQRREETEKSRNLGNVRQKEERLSLLKTEYANEEQEFASFNDKIEASEAELKQQREKYRDKKDDLTALNRKYDEEREKLGKATRYIEQQQSKLEMLKNMQNEYRGYYPGVRAVLKNRDQLKGIRGSVGELIATDKEYMTALDTALGAQAQNIVIQDEQSAKSAIRFLKAQKNGFATFLPMDTIRPRHLSGEIRKQIENSRIDAQIMSEISYAPNDIIDVLKHLLGTTVVAENIDAAGALAGEINHRARIVTKDGETIMPGGAMSGGSRNNKGSVIENQREMTETEEKLKAYQSTAASMKETVKKRGEEVAGMMQDLSEIESEVEGLAESHENLISQKERLGYQMDAKSETMKVLADELKLADDQPGAVDYDRRIKDAADELEVLDERIRMMSASDKDKKAELAQLNDEENAIERELAAVKERSAHNETELQRLEEAHEEILEAIEETKNQQAMVAADLNNLDIDQLENEKAELAAKVEHLYEDTELVSDKQSELRREYNSLIESRDQSSKKLDELQETLRGYTGRKEKLDVKIETRIEYLSETYKITYEKAKETYTDLTDIDQKRRQISLNKKSIEELGPVNIGAIEEFEQVSERYEFLKSQENDLMEARETLLEVIAEMDEEVAVRFKTAFEKINAHFASVFKEMFGGGQAELRLTDADNYLESGVEIYAQPPGKKLSSLSLLSGGERALTAISVLFSILKVRVSPFIILDEVEAALDESNVIRYAEYLKQLANDTQFIVITHRKGTMEHSDRLFGVTMAERGVSQLISVDLKNYEEKIREEETV
ncbi:chromosome segregation protein SMC [Salinicoccus albus]|uniref:chromosome segregation protein SMC n=1 Tax=Salinicoccus albus TaxID=418756 RepID=UPI00037AF4C1|nr:chromosome segregation protein SMC [Salinicoccus albus]